MAEQKRALGERAGAALKTVPGAVAFALIGALLWTWSATGEAFGAGFGDRVIQLGFMALIVVVQRISLMLGIVVAILLAGLAVLLYEGDMASTYWVGQFFLKSLKMIIVPLVVFAMITGITSMGDVRKLGRIGGRTVLYYTLTTAIAVVIGAVIVNIVEPGVGVAMPADLDAIPDKVKGKEGLGLSDIFLGFVSNNIVESMAKMQMLPLIVFSLIFGAILTTIGDKGKPVIAVCEGGNEAMMKMVDVLMWLAPIGVYGLVAGRFGAALAEHGTDVFLLELAKVRDYSLTVVGGLAIHAVVVIPMLLWTLTGRSPLSYAKGMANALLTAFSTASSAATIPVTLECVEEHNGVDKRSSQFVIPLGATVNMDGTALYEAVAVIFIAQVVGIDLTIGQQLVVILTATLAAIGAAGIPQAGLVTMVIVLQAVDLPLAGIELILAVDWLLDRFRTTVNVWGDAVGAAVIERHGLNEDTEPMAVTTS